MAGGTNARHPRWRARRRERNDERRVQQGRLGVCLLAGLHYAPALRPGYFPYLHWNPFAHRGLRGGHERDGTDDPTPEPPWDLIFRFE